MPSVQKLLNTIDTTYRNSYSVAQKVEWIDVTQRQIFRKVPKEATPYTFTTVDGICYYGLPLDCDRSGIKEVTIENKAGSEKYSTLSYMSVESNVSVSSGTPFYSLLTDMLFLNPAPTSTDEGKKVYMIYNKRPAALSSTSLEAIPELEEDFHELLILGCLERIARARGEIDDKNNFAADYNALMAEYERQYKLRQPDYYRPKDVMPMRRGQWSGAKRRSYVSDLLPPGL